jgi:hypothetical protein
LFWQEHWLARAIPPQSHAARTLHANFPYGRVSPPPPAPSAPGGPPGRAVVGVGGGGAAGHPAAERREGSRGVRRAAGPRRARPPRDRYRLAPGGRRWGKDQQRHGDILHRRLLRQVRRGRRSARHPAHLQRARGAHTRGDAFASLPDLPLCLAVSSRISNKSLLSSEIVCCDYKHSYGSLK